MFSVTKHYKIWFGLSGALMIASIVLMAVWGLRAGIDFRGGTLAQLRFPQAVTPSDVREALLLGGLTDAIVQPVGGNEVIIKTETLDESGVEVFRKTLTGKFGTYEEVSFESIGPSIGRELLRKAYWQVILVTLGIVLYITYAFRKIGKQAKSAKLSPWRLGFAAVVALVHDLAITIGVFVLLGHYRGVEVDALFITALLTVLGFSIHDTIVVFDRIREYLAKYGYMPLSSIIDYSVVSTMARSINTSSTVVFVLTSMLLFGGETVFNFVLALLVGIVVGTYSSIFIASPLLNLWRSKK